MGNNRRPGTLYIDAWNKDVDKAFAMAAVHPTGEKFTDLFDSFTVMPAEPLAGFRRFHYASAHSNHPSFKPGVLYAIPLRDGNKHLPPASMGMVEINPHPDRRLDTSYITELLIDAIEDSLEENGVTNDDVVLGNFMVEHSNPFEMEEGLVAASAVLSTPVEDRYVVMRGEEVLGTFVLNGSDLHADVVTREEAIAEEVRGYIKEYAIGHGAQDEITVLPVGNTGLVYRKPVTSLTYIYTARVYSTVEEPDGWGFYGIPANS